MRMNAHPKTIRPEAAKKTDATLPLPNPLPAGGDHLLAYRRWREV